MTVGRELWASIMIVEASLGIPFGESSIDISVLERAINAGRSWAEREAETIRDQGRPMRAWMSPWYHALALVDDPRLDREIVTALAEVANDAAARHWYELSSQDPE